MKLAPVLSLACKIGGRLCLSGLRVENLEAIEKEYSGYGIVFDQVKSLNVSLLWLFFQNATQVQLHGGKTPIVLYQDMKLQFELHISIEPAAGSLQRFNWSGPPPGT